MARWYEPTQEQIDGWAEWVASRPLPIRRVAMRFYPWELYRMKSTGQRVTIASFSEHEDSDKITLKVDVTGRFNAVMFEREVFGIDPDDLDPCELPQEGEILGAGLTDVEDIQEYIRVTRPFILKAVKKEQGEGYTKMGGGLAHHKWFYFEEG